MRRSSKEVSSAKWIAIATMAAPKLDASYQADMPCRHVLRQAGLWKLSGLAVLRGSAFMALPTMGTSKAGSAAAVRVASSATGASALRPQRFLRPAGS